MCNSECDFRGRQSENYNNGNTGVVKYVRGGVVLGSAQVFHDADCTVFVCLQKADDTRFPQINLKSEYF